MTGRTCSYANLAARPCATSSPPPPPPLGANVSPQQAIKLRDETEETINKLGGVVFVQTVEGSALSVVVPLMMAGFRYGQAKSKRLCARIIGNMSKLVEEPLVRYRQ